MNPIFPFGPANQEPVSVLEYGAIGDGIHDDTDAVAAAIAALVLKGGGRLVFGSNKTYRFATVGHAAIHLSQVSNISVEMGENSELFMDNFDDEGMPTSQGIHVEGPCHNIEFHGVKLRFGMPSHPERRPSWNGFYFIGQNIGGDFYYPPGGYSNDQPQHYRGNPDGTQNVAAIYAGTIRDIKLIGCSTENTCGCMIELSNVDGAIIENFYGKMSWGNGIFADCFRRVHYKGIRLENVDDDGLGLWANEGGIVGNNIEDDFHGELSTISDVVINHRIDYVGTVPAGGVSIGGVRDIAISNVVINDKYRALKFEYGTEYSGRTDYAGLGIHFLAPRRITISNVVIRNCSSAAYWFNKESTLASDPKWWKCDVSISDLIIEGCQIFAETYYFDKAPFATPIISGFKMADVKCGPLPRIYSTFAGIHDLVLENVQVDGQLNFNGFIPLGLDPDTLDAGGDPAFTTSNLRLSNVRAGTLSLAGVKGAYLDDVRSENADRAGFQVLGCSDITFTTISVKNYNRLDIIYSNGFTIDGVSKRITGDTVHVTQDDVYSPTGLSILSAKDIWIGEAILQSELDTNNPWISDAKRNSTGISQIGSVRWYHGKDSSQAVQWRKLEFPRFPTALQGDANVSLYMQSDDFRLVRLTTPLTADRTITLSENVCTENDEFEIVRTESCTGAHRVIVNTQAEQSQPGIGYFSTGSFIVSGGSLNPGVNQLLTLKVNGVDLIGAPFDFSFNTLRTAQLLGQAINAHQTLYSCLVQGNAILLRARPDAGATPNGYAITSTVAGDFVISSVQNFAGGAAATGEVQALGSVTFTGGTSSPGVNKVTSIKVNGVELLPAPFDFLANASLTTEQLANVINDSQSTYFAMNYGNILLLQAPPSIGGDYHGATYNGYAVAVTGAGNVTATTSAFAGGATFVPVVPPPSMIFTSPVGVSGHMRFVFVRGTGWTLKEASFARQTYANGYPLADETNLRLYNPFGNILVDEFKNIVAANGAVVIDDQGKLRLSNAAPASSAAFGVAGMMVYDASYLYVCVGASSWKRVALSTF